MIIKHANEFKETNHMQIELYNSLQLLFQEEMIYGSPLKNTTGYVLYVDDIADIKVRADAFGGMAITETYITLKSPVEFVAKKIMIRDGNVSVQYIRYVPNFENRYDGSFKESIVVTV